MRIKKLAQLFNNKQKQLYITALAITKNREMAEDAVHDALLAVSQNKSTIKNLSAYLFMSVRNKALHARTWQNKRESFNEDFIHTAVNSKEQQMFNTKLKEDLDKLPQPQQQTIIMKVFGGMTFKEIAQATENPQNTVASWYRRGIQTLQEKHREH